MRSDLFQFTKQTAETFYRDRRELLETLFDGLTKRTAEEVKDKDGHSKIRLLYGHVQYPHYGRVQLLIEMLIRLYRILKEEDKERFKDRLREYTKQTSGQYIYKLERTEIPRELEKLGGYTINSTRH